MEVFVRAKLFILKKDLKGFFKLVKNDGDGLNSDQTEILVNKIENKNLGFISKEMTESFLNLIIKNLSPESYNQWFKKFDYLKIRDPVYKMAIEKCYDQGFLFNTRLISKQYIKKLLRTRNTTRLQLFLEWSENKGIFNEDDLKEKEILLRAQQGFFDFSEEMISVDLLKEMIREFELHQGYWISKRDVRELLFLKWKNIYLGKYENILLKSLSLSLLKNGETEENDKVFKNLKLHEIGEEKEVRLEGAELLELKSKKNPVRDINLMIKIGQKEGALELLGIHKNALEDDVYIDLRKKILIPNNGEIDSMKSQSSEEIVESLILEISSFKLKKEDKDEILPSALSKYIEFLDDEVIFQYYEDLIYCCIGFEEFEVARTILRRRHLMSELPEIEYVYINSELLRLSGKRNEALDILNDFIHNRPFLKKEAVSIYSLQRELLKDLGLDQSLVDNEDKLKSINKK